MAARFIINVTVLHSNLKSIKYEYLRLDVDSSSELFCFRCRMLLNGDQYNILLHVKWLNPILSELPEFGSACAMTSMI